jgi:hypothetical protein
MFIASNAFFLVGSTSLILLALAYKNFFETVLEALANRQDDLAKRSIKGIGGIDARYLRFGGMLQTIAVSILFELSNSYWHLLGQVEYQRWNYSVEGVGTL